VELAIEVGEVIVKLHFIFEATDLGQMDGFVKSDFSLGSDRLKSRIPRASVGAVEATARGMCVDESRIDDPRMANPGCQLMVAEGGKQTALSETHLIRSANEIQEILELTGRLGDFLQRLLRTGELCGDQAVRVIAA
jgi:hypothetical protein